MSEITLLTLLAIMLNMCLNLPVNQHWTASQYIINTNTQLTR